MRDTIDMAREAGFDVVVQINAVDGSIAHLTAFAALVRADEREQALAAPVQPVAWLYKGDAEFDGKEWRDNICVTTSKQVADWQGKDIQPLYTTPPAAQRPWVGLTDDDIAETDWHLSADREYEQWTLQEQLVVCGVKDFARAIEAKLKEKNT